MIKMKKRRGGKKRKKIGGDTDAKEDERGGRAEGLKGERVGV